MKSRTFVIQLECRPAGSSEAAATASGAYANAYVKANECTDAVRRAQDELEAAGWETTSEAECKEVSAESFELGSNGLEYFEQCQLDGVVLELHTWREQH